MAKAIKFKSRNFETSFDGSYFNFNIKGIRYITKSRRFSDLPDTIKTFWLGKRGRKLMHIGCASRGWNNPLPSKKELEVSNLELWLKDHNLRLDEYKENGKVLIVDLKHNYFDHPVFLFDGIKETLDAMDLPENFKFFYYQSNAGDYSSIYVDHVVKNKFREKFEVRPKTCLNKQELMEFAKTWNSIKNKAQGIVDEVVERNQENLLSLDMEI